MSFLNGLSKIGERQILNDLCINGCTMLKKKKEPKRKDHLVGNDQANADTKLKRKKMMAQEKPKYNNPKHWLLQNEDELT